MDTHQQRQRRTPSHRSPNRRGLKHACRGRVTLKVMAKEQPNVGGESAKAKRLREDAERTMSVNLAEGIALSHLLASFVGVARQA
jgi:hypothetical protein